MSAPPLAACEPVGGEVLRLSRWYTVVAVEAAAAGLLMAVFGLLMLVGMGSPGPVGLAGILPGAALLLKAGFLCWVSWYHLARKPSLVLGRDRLQLWVGKHLRWEVGYGDIAAIGFFVPVHPLFRDRQPRARRLGIKLLSPERFDASYPRLAGSRARLRSRYGFDLDVPTVNSQEPPVRCLEAVLRCYHRFESER